MKVEELMIINLLSGGGLYSPSLALSPSDYGLAPRYPTRGQAQNDDGLILLVARLKQKKALIRM